jgi:hypothetical protein
MLGIHFDPSRPVVASSSFQAGEDTIAAGDAFDWRARGMTELDARALFGAGLLVHQPLKATPGERVDVETPSQQRKRRR